MWALENGVRQPVTAKDFTDYKLTNKLNLKSIQQQSILAEDKHKNKSKSCDECSHKVGTASSTIQAIIKKREMKMQKICIQWVLNSLREVQMWQNTDNARLHSACYAWGWSLSSLDCNNENVSGRRDQVKVMFTAAQNYKGVLTHCIPWKYCKCCTLLELCGTPATSCPTVKVSVSSVPGPIVLNNNIWSHAARTQTNLFKQW
jgi:hypothetical protein